MDATTDQRAQPPAKFRPHMKQGLFLLRQASEYAEELTRNSWDFAVEIPNLREAGLTASDLRWLVCRGFAKHAREITITGQNRRRFQRVGDLTFTKKSCFILTPAGVKFAKTARLDPPSPAAPPAPDPTPAVEHNGSPPSHHPPSRPPTATDATVPKWDHNRHELTVGQDLVKVFKLPSPNQETVLMAFQEEGWPPKIDDPLPPQADILPKRRLHDTIKSLNRNQKNHRIRFMGDGTGEGVCWKLIPADNEDNGATESSSPPR